MTETTFLNLDHDLKERLIRLGASKDRPPHWLIHQAITEYVDREEARAAFRQEAEAAGTDYQADGRHLTQRETAEWLATWGSADQQPAPECHD